MKTRDAFALRNFDSERILARRFFDKFFTGTRPSDNEILPNFNYEADTVEEIYTIQEKLNLMTAPVKTYKAFIEKHRDKIYKHCQNVAVKIVECNGDIETLKRRYSRANELYQRYLKISDDVKELDETITAFLEFSNKKILKILRRQIGKNLKAARIKAGLTQQQLGDRTRIAKPDISRFENGNKILALPTLVKFSITLKVSLDELIFGT